jgi:hypothetical protein
MKNPGVEIRSEILKQEYNNGEGKIACPFCGCENCHVENIEHDRSYDNYKAWAGRGDLYLICFYGECGSKWKLGFGEHKGTVCSGIIVINDCRVQQERKEDLLPSFVGGIDALIKFLSSLFEANLCGAKTTEEKEAIREAHIKTLKAAEMAFKVGLEKINNLAERHNRKGKWSGRRNTSKKEMNDSFDQAVIDAWHAAEKTMRG